MNKTGVHPVQRPVTGDTSHYFALAAELTGTGILSDPWLDGRERFRAEPIVLPRHRAGELSRAAEAMALLHDEVARLCASDPSLVDEFFALTPFQRLMWEAGAPLWHGLARADVFLTTDGPKVCELNSDTPSGEAEAVLLNRAVAARHPTLVDPNARFAERFCRLVERMAQTIDRSGPLTVGILYPTEIVEDLSMILLYQRWLEERGVRVVLGSPFNLRRVGGRPGLFDVPVDVFIRHYKTDWWSERQPPFLDEEPFTDAEPLIEPLKLLLDGVLRRQCVVVNPFGAVLTQNKRSMALLWEAIDRFSPSSQQLIRRYVPYSERLETMAPERLADRARWVLKSDYGCEGAEVILGADVSEEEWRDCLRTAVPRRWIAQERFVPLVDGAGETVNFGVYLIGGATAGWFSRVHRGATSYSARTAATLIEESA